MEECYIGNNWHGLMEQKVKTAKWCCNISGRDASESRPAVSLQRRMMIMNINEIRVKLPEDLAKRITDDKLLIKEWYKEIKK